MKTRIVHLQDQNILFFPLLPQCVSTDDTCGLIQALIYKSSDYDSTNKTVNFYNYVFFLLLKGAVITMAKHQMS